MCALFLLYTNNKGKKSAKKKIKNNKTINIQSYNYNNKETYKYKTTKINLKTQT